MNLKDKYLQYVSDVRRYSPRTVAIYRDILDDFIAKECEVSDDRAVLEALNPQSVRNYEVFLLDDMHDSPKTVNQHLSVLSGFCRYLLREGLLHTNPVRLVKRPKEKKRLPVIYSRDSMEKYFGMTAHDASAENARLVTGGDKLSVELWKRRRNRLIVRALFDMGIRRAELIGLNVGSIDFSRRTARVVGKGNKTREIPLLESFCQEISLYLQTTVVLMGGERPLTDPLFVTEKGLRLYPMAVQRIVSEEMESAGVTGRKSPHVLRHTLATELLDEGTDLNSIKELLGHSSLAATQVYTHNTIDKLKKTYINAHPRAKRGG